MENLESLDEEYWSQRYGRGDTPWDLGRISPPLKAYIDQLKAKQISILIPGCGNGHEAAYLLEQGFENLCLVDMVSSQTKRLKENLGGRGPGLQIITADFFEMKGSFDLILEQTFFCALDPALRPAYVAQAAALLRPGGRLAGVLFDRSFEGGPPFGGSTAEYRELFGKSFILKTLAPCYNSMAKRAGSEVFIIALKKVD